MATFTLNVNGTTHTVECDPSVRLLWVLRDLLGIHGPKYGCGLDVCKACTCHINGTNAFHPCSVEVSALLPSDQITTIEGLAGTVNLPLHPVQQAWIDHDVAQCGYCQPGQIMTAVALLDELKATGGTLTQDTLDGIRDVCRCGTYPRVREAIAAVAVEMGIPTNL